MSIKVLSEGRRTICLHRPLPEVLFQCRHVLSSYLCAFTPLLLCVWTGSKLLKLKADLESVSGCSEHFFNHYFSQVFVCASGRGCAETRRVYKRLQQTSDMEEMEKTVNLEKQL